MTGWALAAISIGSPLALAAFGENLTVDGLVESDLCIGEVLAVPALSTSWRASLQKKRERLRAIKPAP